MSTIMVKITKEESKTRAHLPFGTLRNSKTLFRCGSAGTPRPTYIPEGRANPIAIKLSRFQICILGYC